MVWWCFCGAVVVFLWWCLCGGVFVVLFFFGAVFVVVWCFCGGVFALVFLWWCGGVFVVVWWCFCGGVLSSTTAQSSAEVMAVFKDCHQRRPKVLLK